MRINVDDPVLAPGLHVVRALEAAGHTAYLCGGAVRDSILGLVPKDVDVATSATPEEVATIFPHTTGVGAKFGIQVVVLDDGVTVEVARFRADGQYADGRRPDSVTWASDREDARRRDFTVNALFAKGDGEVVDYVGGITDIQKRRLRTVGFPAERFEEDHLRLLRAVRFACTLSFDLDSATVQAMTLLSDRIKLVSAERIREELTRILCSATPAFGLGLLKWTQLLKETLPEIAALDGVEQPADYHPEGDVLTHTKLLLAHVKNEASATLRWAALFHDVGKPGTFHRTDRIRFEGHDALGAEITESAMRRFRFSNEDRERIVALVADHMRPMGFHHMRPGRLAVFLSQPHAAELVELHRLDALGSCGDLTAYHFALSKLKELEDRPAPTDLLRGADLVALGFEPGPQYKKILDRVRDAQLDGKISDVAGALELVKTEFGA